MKINRPTTLNRWLLLALGIWFLLAGTALAQEEPPPPAGEDAEGAAVADEASDEAAPPASDAETPAEEAEAVEEDASPDPAKAGSPPADAQDAPVETPVVETGEPVAPAPPTETREIDLEADAEMDAELAEDAEIDAFLNSPETGGAHLSARIGTHTIPIVTRGYYELHFNVISDEHSANDWLSFYLLMVSADLTKNNQVAIRADLEQRYVADPGENGLWFGDLRFYYNRKFKIPIPNFTIPGVAQALILAPTSRASRERSYILKPRATLILNPSVGPVNFRFDYFLQYQFATYAESNELSHPNVQLLTGYYFYVYYSPVKWFTPMFTWYNYWAVPYESREGTRNPTRPYYGFDISMNFALPMPKAAPAISVALAYTQGANMLEGGVYRTYFGKRDQSDIYMAIDIRY